MEVYSGIPRLPAAIEPFGIGRPRQLLRMRIRESESCEESQRRHLRVCGEESRRPPYKKHTVLQAPPIRDGETLRFWLVREGGSDDGERYAPDYVRDETNCRSGISNEWRRSLSASRQDDDYVKPSETLRRTRRKAVKIKSELHGDMQSAAEMSAPLRWPSES